LLIAVQVPSSSFQSTKEHRIKGHVMGMKKKGGGLWVFGIRIRELGEKGYKIISLFPKL